MAARSLSHHVPMKTLAPLMQRRTDAVKSASGRPRESMQISSRLLSDILRPIVVKTLRGWFLGRFSYSRYLAGARPGRTALEEFLLTSRAGHCEYFASATVLLLRHAGIPARYTVGYAAHEWSTIEQRWLVRARDAHAWALAWIDGAWVDAVGGQTIAIEAPGTRTTIATVPRGGAEDIDRAVKAANAAFPAWSKTPPRERGRILQKVADAIEARLDELALIIAEETGNAIRTQARPEARMTADIARYFGGLGSELKGETIPLGEHVLSYTRREPIGAIHEVVKIRQRHDAAYGEHCRNRPHFIARGKWRVQDPRCCYDRCS